MPPYENATNSGTSLTYYYPSITGTYYPIDNSEDWRADIANTISNITVGSTEIALKVEEKQELELKPTLITHNNGSTVVYWNDDTRTAVRLCEEDMMNGVDSTYTAFCIALAKKIYGSNSALHRLVHEIDEDTIREKEEKERQKQLEKKREREKINHERKVRKLAKQMMLTEEAMNYINKKKKEKVADDIVSAILKEFYK